MRVGDQASPETAKADQRGPCEKHEEEEQDRDAHVDLGQNLDPAVQPAPDRDQRDSRDQNDDNHLHIRRNLEPEGKVKARIGLLRPKTKRCGQAKQRRKDRQNIDDMAGPTPDPLA